MMTQESLNQDIRAMALEHGQVHNGPLVFVPSAEKTAEILGMGKGNLYRFGTQYTQKVEQATGLWVVNIDKNNKRASQGRLLLSKTCEMRPCTEDDLATPIHPIMHAVDQLSQEQRAALLRQLIDLDRS